MKIIVEGATYGGAEADPTGEPVGTLDHSGKSLDADVVLKSSSVAERARPPLLPRPPSALTTASILKYRGKIQ